MSPRKCLKEGKDVTSCSMEFFRKVKAMCATEFMTYASCLERGSANMEFSNCRNTQVRSPNWNCNARKYLQHRVPADDSL